MQQNKACSNPECKVFDKYILPFEAKFCPMCGTELYNTHNYKIISKLRNNFYLRYFGGHVDGMVPIVRNDKIGFINYMGQEVIPCVFDETFGFTEGLAPVLFNEKWGCVDMSGKVAIPFKYDQITNFHQGIACVYKDHRFGWIDRTGKQLIHNEYPWGGDYYNGIINTVNRFSENVAIDINENIILKFPAKYDVVTTPFSCGLAVVTDANTGLEGYVNIDGEEVIPCRFETACTFEKGTLNNYARVKTNSGWAVIDQFGKVILSGIFPNYIKPYNNKFYTNHYGCALVYRVMSNTKRAELVATIDGVEFTYEWLKNGYMVAKKDGKYGVLDNDYLEALPFIYDNIQVFENTDTVIAELKSDGLFYIIRF